ncbi:MAG: hypothetical protein Q4B73_10325, partial [Lachnospiraceae bacterium]|nr:hypothetical protein [Lachnospiraceae bacterium]
RLNKKYITILSYRSKTIALFENKSITNDAVAFQKYKSATPVAQKNILFYFYLMCERVPPILRYIYCILPPIQKTPLHQNPSAH